MKKESRLLRAAVLLAERVSISAAVVGVASMVLGRWIPTGALAGGLVAAGALTAWGGTRIIGGANSRPGVTTSCIVLGLSPIVAVVTFVLGLNLLAHGEARVCALGTSAAVALTVALVARRDRTRAALLAFGVLIGAALLVMGAAWYQLQSVERRRSEWRSKGLVAAGMDGVEWWRASWLLKPDSPGWQERDPPMRNRLERALIDGTCYSCRSLREPTTRSELAEYDLLSGVVAPGNEEWAAGGVEALARGEFQTGMACELAAQCDAITRLAAVSVPSDGDWRFGIMAAMGSHCLVGLAACASGATEAEAACLSASAREHMHTDYGTSGALAHAQDRIITMCQVAPSPGHRWLDQPRWMREQPVFCRAASVVSTRRRLDRAEQWETWVGEQRDTGACSELTLPLDRIDDEELVNAMAIACAATAEDRVAGTVACVLAAIRASGAVPPTLDACGCGDARDPYSGAPLAYRVFERGFILYSIGPGRSGGPVVIPPLGRLRAREGGAAYNASIGYRVCVEMPDSMSHSE